SAGPLPSPRTPAPMPLIEVVRTYLEMTDPAQLRPAREEDARVRMERVGHCPASFYRYLYAAVGERWQWRDRTEWSDARIRERLDDPRVSLGVLYVEGAPAGWAEHERHADGSVEIVYFGLLPEYAGRGLGKRFLTWAVERGWSDGASRVWLHTCTLDSPHALPNYLARGFRRTRTERYHTEPAAHGVPDAAG
ncbi:MAG TPA: GNAT family N-acetyltransferase, partial [Gemmatimonadaceae bacterium]|nr:GNAT family N-acetyltransferase [Gemmatimonadaceae bacterium]